MGVLNFLTGTAGYTAILAAFGLAVAAHFFAPRSWSALAWTIAFGVLGAAFVGQREITSAAQIKVERAEAREQNLIADIATSRADALKAINLMAAARQTAVAEIDSRNQKELRHALEENRRRAGDPARYGMRFTGARCPADRGVVPATATTASVGAAAEQGIEVTGDARRAVSDLREEILTDLQALKAMAEWAALEKPE